MNPRDARGLYVCHANGRRYLCSRGSGKSRAVVYGKDPQGGAAGDARWYSSPADHEDAGSPRWPERRMRRGEPARVLAIIARVGGAS